MNIRYLQNRNSSAVPIISHYESENCIYIVIISRGKKLRIKLL